MRIALVLALAAGIVVTILLAADAMDTLELPARDLALRALPERPAGVTLVIAIDEESLRARGPWPWTRATLAQIVDRCADAGARAVVLDILLSDARPDDDTLAAAMQRIPTFAVSVLVEEQQWLVPSPALRRTARIAHGNFELDRDGILRRFASTKQSGTRSQIALALEAATMIRPASIPVGRSISPAFRTPPRAIPLLRADDVLAGRFDADALRGRIVFVGPTASGLGDRVMTPVSRATAPDAGVAVHAAATESLVRGELVHPAPPIAGGALAALLVAVLLPLRTRSRALRLALTLAAFLFLLGGGATLLALTGVAVPFVSLLAVLAVLTIAVEAVVLTASLRASRTAFAEQREHDLASKRLLAHELKTPIASMRNLTQLLAGFDLSDAERQRVAVLLQSEAGKLEGMVQALLDLERLALRDFASRARVTDLGALVRARADLARAAGRRPMHVHDAGGIEVRGDPMLLERVVDNLLSNAMKYTPRDAPIEVTVRESRGEAILEIADRGPGIAEAESERIFQRFYRGASAEGTEGLGLGLAFVAEIARWHGGSAAVENREEGGARFRIVLPLAKGAA